MRILTKKTWIATLLIVMLVSNMNVKAWNDKPFEFDAGNYKLVQQPGMGLRIEDKTV